MATCRRTRATWVEEEDITEEADTTCPCPCRHIMDTWEEDIHRAEELHDVEGLLRVVGLEEAVILVDQLPVAVVLLPRQYFPLRQVILLRHLHVMFQQHLQAVPLPEAEEELPRRHLPLRVVHHRVVGAVAVVVLVPLHVLLVVEVVRLHLREVMCLLP